jgi:hypothetical protein
MLFNQKCVAVWTLAACLASFPIRDALAQTAGPVGDRELATIVVGKDGARDVERKLGGSSCLVPSASGETTSFLYNVKVDGLEGGYGYLRLEVNGQVDAITISKDPPLVGVCYAPARVSTPIRTAKGLALGASQAEVEKLYGKPTESFAVGAMARYRYVVVLDHPFEWDLVFRNGRLVEWTVVTEQ